MNEAREIADKRLARGQISKEEHAEIISAIRANASKTNQGIYKFRRISPIVLYSCIAVLGAIIGIMLLNYFLAFIECRDWELSDSCTTYYFSENSESRGIRQNPEQKRNVMMVGGFAGLAISTTCLYLWRKFKKL